MIDGVNDKDVIKVVKELCEKYSVSMSYFEQKRTVAALTQEINKLAWAEQVKLKTKLERSAIISLKAKGTVDEGKSCYLGQMAFLLEIADGLKAKTKIFDGKLILNERPFEINIQDKSFMLGKAKINDVYILKHAIRDGFEAWEMEEYGKIADTEGVAFEDFSEEAELPSIDDEYYMD